MITTIGVLAHVDAGKTTFSEQLLYETAAIKARGRVDHQDTFLDNHALERARGITIFAEQGRFTYNDRTYHLIDTPGHVDFSPEMERSVRVMDVAVVIISAVEGVQGHTETVWQLLRQHRVPTVIFLNKTDREGANIEAVVTQIQQLLCEDAVLYHHNFIDAVAERDEQMLDAFLEGTVNDDLVTNVATTLIKQQQLIPIITGAALRGEGVTDVLACIHRFIQPTATTEGPFTADVFKIRHEHDQRLTFAKARSGILHVRDDVTVNGGSYKITELRLYNGTRFESVQQVACGEIFAMKGLPTAIVGDMINGQAKRDFTLVPTLQATCHVKSSLHIKEILKMLRQLEAEEPTLRVFWQERHQEIQLHVMGVIQLEVLTHILQERYQLDVTFGDPTILYQETCATFAYGYGHFEPLKHYAEVHLHIEPNPRGTGITFSNQCHADHLSVGHMRLIEQHIFEREHHGLLTGAPLTDMHITLLTGAAHHQHTDGGDFREATIRALRQALEQVDNVLLEPFYRFRLRADIDHLGRMMSDIQQAHGTFDAPILTETHALLTGRVPVATFMQYPITFAAYTNGKGAISLQFDGYDTCHNTADVIERSGYRKDADPDYSSSSIFCAKGKGYTVPWHEAADMMHCEKKTVQRR